VPALGSVLVVADRVDDAAAALIAEVLGASGADVQVTGSSVDAAVAVQHDGSPTLVVTTATGSSLVADLRSSASRRQRDAAVVVVVDSPDDADAALTAGADSVLIRPVEAERLVEAVAQLT
jgi:DNA-binding response OmpR family regulator